MTALIVAAQGTLVAQNIFFYVIAAVMVVCALRVVTTKNIMHAALYLMVVLAGVAAMFILLGAEFVGVTQVLVYIGAVVVLFLFGIMLTRAQIGGESRPDHDRRVLPALIALMLMAVMGYATFDWAGEQMLPYGEPTTTATVSDALFSTWIVAFEAVSVLLLAALIGAIVLARRD